MSILKVARLGNPVLREPAKPLPLKEISSSWVQQLIRDMVETMREYDGVGLAAPQVHQPSQILVVEALEDSKSPKDDVTPLTVLINPVISVISERLEEDWEGCLSIPDLRGLVPRYQEIEVQGIEPSGKKSQFRARGFFARVIQHEYDHLIGKVFLDRMRSLDSLAFLQEYAKYWQKHD